jgi:hypothetical protein
VLSVETLIPILRQFKDFLGFLVAMAGARVSTPGPMRASHDEQVDSTKCVQILHILEGRDVAQHSDSATPARRSNNEGAPAGRNMRDQVGVSGNRSKKPYEKRGPLGACFHRLRMM